MYDQEIKYIGCIGVKESMRTLCPAARSEVAKESINRLCIANRIQRRSESKSCFDKDRMLDNEPNLLHSGTDVQLCVTTKHLNVISIKTGQILIQHEMPNVSFASQGDGETVDFVAYVAKNSNFGRACFVLNCYGNGKNVLDTIARGFQLRTQKILYNNSTPSKSTNLIDGCFDTQDTVLNVSGRTNNENDCNNSIVAEMRATLEKEPWYHGSYLNREQSEERLKQDGDFLVRESLLAPGHFVLSVAHNGNRLHLLFDSINEVKTQDMEFDDISHLIRYHHDSGYPIVAENLIIYLRSGVRPTSGGGH